ncbi:hypothetical protein M3P05_08255 [Sansalvadorimonas sp. 2012CJ34-2]|uniref:Peptidase C58 YopT-type domain-containing protein n=1 Tax=Parendozoicomonas callyspongiae TaxID=2942213 RepID=A0ABT0PEW8_9GAMM|nr:hypothetical protein [Sansalvadorimonas sp. 2012CJ34-2]MCL6269928.1 hypothetical protein [Sansalvadorimonas sp. 2012CJ34-2]
MQVAASKGPGSTGQISGLAPNQICDPKNWGKFRERGAVAWIRDDLRIQVNVYNKQNLPGQIVQKPVVGRLCQQLSQTYSQFLRNCHWLSETWPSGHGPIVTVASVEDFDQFLIRNINSMKGDSKRAQAFRRGRLIAMLVDDKKRLEQLYLYQDSLQLADFVYIARHSQPETAENILLTHQNKLQESDFLAIADSHPELVFDTMKSKDGFRSQDPMSLLIPLCWKSIRNAKEVLNNRENFHPAIHLAHMAAIASYHPELVEALYEDIRNKIISTKECQEDDLLAMMVLVKNKGCANRVLYNDVELANTLFKTRNGDQMAGILLEIYSWHPDFLLYTYGNFEWLCHEETKQICATKLIKRQYPAICNTIQTILQGFTPQHLAELACRFPRYVSALIKPENNGLINNKPELADLCNQYAEFSNYYFQCLYPEEQQPEQPEQQTDQKSRLEYDLVSPWAKRHLRERTGQFLVHQQQPAWEDARAMQMTLPDSQDNMTPEQLRILKTYPAILMQYMDRRDQEDNVLSDDLLQASFQRSAAGCKKVMGLKQYSDETKLKVAGLFVETLRELLEKPETYLKESSNLFQEQTLLSLLLYPHQKYNAVKQFRLGKLDQFSNESLFKLAVAQPLFAEALGEKPDVFARFTPEQRQELQEKYPFFSDKKHDQQSERVDNPQETNEVYLTPCVSPDDSGSLENQSDFLKKYYDLVKTPFRHDWPDYIPWNQGDVLGWRARLGGICSGWAIYISHCRFKHLDKHPMRLRKELAEKLQGAGQQENTNRLEKLDFLQRNCEIFLGEKSEVSRIENGLPELCIDKFEAFISTCGLALLGHGGHFIAVHREWSHDESKAFYYVDDANKGSWVISPGSYQKLELASLINERLMQHGGYEPIIARPILQPNSHVKVNPTKYRDVQPV